MTSFMHWFSWCSVNRRAWAGHCRAGTQRRLHRSRETPLLASWKLLARAGRCLSSSARLGEARELTRLLGAETTIFALFLFWRVSHSHSSASPVVNPACLHDGEDPRTYRASPYPEQQQKRDNCRDYCKVSTSRQQFYLFQKPSLPSTDIRSSCSPSAPYVSSWWT